MAKKKTTSKPKKTGPDLSFNFGRLEGTRAGKRRTVSRGRRGQSFGS